MTNYKTAEVAAAIGVHPNTVRLYEEWEMIPKPKRKPNGYCIFTDFHIEQFKLARLAFQIEVLQNGLRKKIIKMVKTSATGDFDKALSLANPLDLLTQFGIADKRKSLVKDLSGGQKQRLFIILALIPNPQVVFLDELTTGLDAKARREVWKILSGLKGKGLTILLTSHFMDEVEVLCDQICILKKGEIVFYGTVSEAVKNSPCEKFEDAYLWYTDEEVQADENL